MKKIVALLSFLLLSGLIFAQSADKMTEVLESDKVTLGQASYFIATASGKIQDTESEEDAVKVMKAIQFADADADPSQYISVKDLSWMLVCTWKIEGSLMLKLFPGPRYACKQLKADGILNDFDDPDSIPDGHRFFNILTDCMALYAEQE
ncbi:hypothetical protein [Treponema sp.]|uniref:hypothetical protein n=1 Tax=Treponema sp. TaxID=166 RepID=UPI0025CB7F68|nr:hypothetical protein [Treponema sp.]MCR5217933.1 hypothetical protein [Treponema sp.]